MATFTASRGTVTIGAQTWGVVNVTIPNSGYWNLDYYVNGQIWGSPGFGYGWTAGAFPTDVPQTTITNPVTGASSFGPIFSIPLTFSTSGTVLTFASVSLTLSYYTQPGGTLLSSSTVQLQ